MIWTILGVSVAIVALFCVSVAELLVGHPLFERSRGHIAAVFAASGIAAWFLGRFLGRRRVAKESGEETRIFVLFDLRYWGPMFVVLGVITLFIDTIKLRKTDITVAVAPVPPPPKSPPIARAPEPPPPPKVAVSFPDLRVQGIIFRESRPTVILNGRSYERGDLVDDATVKEITRESVTLEKGGELKFLSFAGASAMGSAAGK